MARIHLHKGESFFGNILNYDWKGKFLVVEISEITVNDKHDCRIISWDNVESVYDIDYKKEEEVK